MIDKYNDFEILADWLKNLIERASMIDINKNAFDDGVLQGYYECISHIMIQLDTLGLKEKLKDELLYNFNPDDLLSGKAKNPFKNRVSKSQEE